MNEINLEYKDKYLKYKKKYLYLKNEVGGSGLAKGWKKLRGKKSCNNYTSQEECQKKKGTHVLKSTEHNCIWMPNYQENEGKCVMRTEKREIEKIKIITSNTKPLGEGSYGSVYSIDENTVVKVINRSGLSENGKKRLEEERNILRNIKYPFATYLKKDKHGTDYFKYDNKAYLIMNKLPGMDLFDYINKIIYEKKNLEDITRKYLIVQMILFNYYNHINKVIHLDLKPENYYFDGSTNKLYILDYGLAECFKGSNICKSGKIEENRKIEENIGFKDIYQGTAQFIPPSMNSNTDEINTKYLDDYFIISVIIFAELYNSHFKKYYYLNYYLDQYGEPTETTKWIEWKEEKGHKEEFKYEEHPVVIKEINAYKLFNHYVINYIETYNELPEKYDNNYHRSNVTTALGFFGIYEKDDNLIAALNYIDQFHSKGFNDDMKTKENNLWNHIEAIAKKIQL